MKETEVVPDPTLMESMRAVGYTMETAIADIIDNSITAGGDQVDIRFTATPEPRIAILDNGSGMDEETLTHAMQLAGRSPATARPPYDLGRFGLGLKTASLSQARSLTVATKHDQRLRAARWDLDYLATTGKWLLQALDDAEICALPWIDTLASQQSGTLVLWEKLDQLHPQPGRVEAHLDELMAGVRDHLGLVFHRFTSTAMKPLTKPLTLRINGAGITRVDPFLTQHRGTRQGLKEEITIGDVKIGVQPYTLPYTSKLSASERRMAQVAGLMRDSQGFYVYRAGRLLLWGTWFRIMPKDELGKLARVQVDIPNTLDHLWSLDIKKSAASPPPEIRDRLKRIADQIVAPSRRVHQYRGRNLADDKVEHLWKLIEERDTFRYELNLEHPLVTALFRSLDGAGQADLTRLLRTLEATFPVEDAYTRLGSDNTHIPSPVDVAELARVFFKMRGESVDVLATRLALIEPFNKIKDLENFIREAISG